MKVGGNHQLLRGRVHRWDSDRHGLLRKSYWEESWGWGGARRLDFIILRPLGPKVNNHRKEWGKGKLFEF